MTSPTAEPLSFPRAILFAVAAVICFHAAYSLDRFVAPQLLILGYPVCMTQLARLNSTRQSFYLSLSAAYLCFAPQLVFFWSIFGRPAIVLWLILALWIALDVVLTQLTLARFGVKIAAALVPFLWMGLEYTRSELYYLKFSWLNISYTRVTDELIRQGAQLLVVPTMDVTDWGAQEHMANARVAPVRAAEYGVPIFRLASSGISQAVDQRGQIISRAAFPGEGETLFAAFRLPAKGALPLDRWLAPFSVIVVAAVSLIHLFWRWMPRRVMDRRRAATVMRTV